MTRGYGQRAGAGNARCGPPSVWGAAACVVVSGGVLLSHEVPLAVPSALSGLASGFGMGPGVSPML